MKNLILIFMTGLLMAGCAHNPSQVQNQQAMAEGCGGGALLGAAVGAGLGAIVGGGGGAKIGAAAGAALGAAGGCAFASSVTDEHTAKANQENLLNAQLQRASSLVDAAKTRNQILTQQIQDAKMKVAQIKKDSAGQRQRKIQLNQQRQELAQKLDSSEKEERQLTASLNDLVADRAKSPQTPQTSQALDQHINELNAQLKTLRDNNKALAAIRQRI